MKNLRKACALLLVLATLLSFAGCVNHNWSVKTDKEEIAAGVYIYYMMTAYNDAVAKLDEINKDLSDADKKKVDVLTATIDGKTGRDWIMDETRNYCKRHFAVLELCDKRDIKLSKEDISSIDGTLNYMVAYYGTFFEQVGISVESVRKVYENSYLYADLLYSYFDTKGDKALKEEDIKNYFSENYIAYKALDVSYTFTSNGKETKYSDAEIKERSELIDQYFKEATAAEKADIDDYNKKFVNRNLKEGEKETEPRKFTLLFATKDDTTTTAKYDKEFFDKIKKAKAGEFLKFEDKDKGVYLIQKFDEFSDDSKKYKEVRENCIAELAEDDFITILNDYAGTMSFTFNEKALEEYSLDTLIGVLNSNG